MTEPNIDLKDLQKRFAEVDLLHRAASSSGLEFLVLQLAETKVRIYKEQKHARPHFHIEYKKIYSASYGITPLEKLAGTMPTKYEKPILEWAATHEHVLLGIWNALQEGSDPIIFIEDVNKQNNIVETTA